jgi:hypothetical protein
VPYGARRFSPLCQQKKNPNKTVDLPIYRVSKKINQNKLNTAGTVSPRAIPSQQAEDPATILQDWRT